MKNRNGITLVALVITVIILLILAGVAMSMITGNDGIFTKANEAATLYNQKAQEEADQVQGLMDKMNKYFEDPIPTNPRIGDYIDLGTNLLTETILPGTRNVWNYSTKQYENEKIRDDETIKADYRIFYVEGEKVYAILADYLPNSTNIIANSGIDGIKQLENSDYVISGITDVETLESALAGPYTRSNNRILVNALTGAPLADKKVSVTLGPTYDLLEKSYNTTNPNAKIGSVFDEWLGFLQLTLDQSIYVPRLGYEDSDSVSYKRAYGYWLSSKEDQYYEWRIAYYGELASSPRRVDEFGIRPVVVLGADVELKYNATRQLWEVVVE